MADEFTVNLREALATCEEPYTLNPYRKTGSAGKWTFTLLPCTDADLLAQSLFLGVQRERLPMDEAGNVDLQRTSAYALTCTSVGARAWSLRRFVRPPSWLEEIWGAEVKDTDLGMERDPLSQLPTWVLEELAEAVRLKVRRSGRLLSEEGAEGTEEAAGKS